MREEELNVATNNSPYHKNKSNLVFLSAYNNPKIFSWSAVFAGTVLIIGLNFLLFLVSLALDLSIYPTSNNGKIAFALGSFLFLAILTIIIMFVGGWVAGYLGRPFAKNRTIGEIYGFSAWALALIVTILLTSQTSQFVTNSSYLVNREIPIRAVAILKTNTIGTSSAVDEQALMQISFALFFLSAIGGLSAAFGGRCGMQYNRKEKFDEL